MVDSIGPYFLGESLGEGNFSKVRLGIHKSTKEKVAIKIISKQLCLLEETTREQIQKEIFILCLLKNPNVLRLYDVYETEKELFLVMEYADKSDLFVRLSEKKMFTPNEALRYFQQLIFGLEYCHAHLVVHRDLKLENLLLNQKGQLKIGDFGMARLMKSNSLLETSCGSPHYASPEVIEGKRYDGTKSDVWSCGVILFTLLTGRLPFHDNNVVQLFKKVRTRQFMLPKNLSKDQVDLICRMLTIDPDRRISIPEIKQHKWFRSNFPDNYEPPNVIIRKSIANYYSLSTSNMDLISSFKTLNISQAKNLRKILTNPQITPDHSLFQEFQEFPELQNSNLFIDDSRNQESVEPQKNGIELDVDQDNVAKKENSNEIKHDEWVEIDFNEFPIQENHKSKPIEIIQKVKKQPKKIKPEREKKKRLVDWFGKTIEEKNERKKRKKPTIIPLIVFQSQKNLLLFTKDLQSFFKKKKISWKYPNLYNLQVAKKGLEFKILLTELFNDPNSNRIKIKIIYKKGSEKYFKNIGNQILKKIK